MLLLQSCNKEKNIPPQQTNTALTSLNLSPVAYLDGHYSGIPIGNSFLTFLNTHWGWLCDGFRYSISLCSSQKYLHMVWGKGPNFVNWVFEDNWNQGLNSSRTYNYNRKMITNINPN